MRAQSKKSLLTTGAGILGAVAGGVLAGNPMLGYKAGSLLGTLGSGLIPDDQPERTDRYIHPYLGPNTGFTSAPVTRPFMQTTWDMPEATRADNAVSLLGSVAGPASALLMGNVMKGKTPLLNQPTAAVPTARQGTFIPAAAPSHEEQGVKVVKRGTGEVMAEAEGDEFIIPSDSVNQILSAQDPAEIGIRFMNEVNRLKAKGHSEFMARDGLQLNSLFSPNPYGAFNRHETGVPFATPTYTAPVTSVDAAQANLNMAATPQPTHAPPVFPQGIVMNTSPSTPIPGGVPPSSNLIPFPHQGVPLNLRPDLSASPSAESNINPPDPLITHFNQAIEAQERANRQGNLLRFSHGLINLRGLMEPMRPSAPFTMAPLQRAELHDPSAARINQLDREVGIGLEALSQLSAPERIAGVSGLISNYGDAMSQISQEKTNMMNQQASINQQVTNEEIQARLALSLQNYQKRAAEAAGKHGRDQIGLAGISDAITGIIQSSGQSATNIKELSMIRDMLSKLQSEQDKVNAYLNFRAKFNVPATGV